MSLSSPRSSASPCSPLLEMRSESSKHSLCTAFMSSIKRFNTSSCCAVRGASAYSVTIAIGKGSTSVTSSKRTRPTQRTVTDTPTSRRFQSSTSNAPPTATTSEPPIMICTSLPPCFLLALSNKARKRASKRCIVLDSPGSRRSCIGKGRHPSGVLPPSAFQATALAPRTPPNPSLLARPSKGAAGDLQSRELRPQGRRGPF
mmetsp:Transcript_35426/g.87113  ORF Transcript_35426/g.87113 Transcript_35426/m.87113 type:complete len:202 (-) Transcript_35426:72-677(-)